MTTSQKFPPLGMSEAGSLEGLAIGEVVIGEVGVGKDVMTVDEDTCKVDEDVMTDDEDTCKVDDDDVTIGNDAACEEDDVIVVNEAGCLAKAGDCLSDKDEKVPQDDAAGIERREGEVEVVHESVDGNVAKGEHRLLCETWNQNHQC